MFEFCTRSGAEGEAFRRLTAARLVRKFRTILEALASGRLLLSNAVLLRDHVNAANVAELITATSAKSKREVEALIARLAPKPDVRFGSCRCFAGPITGSPPSRSLGAPFSS
jgi:hypothetical protein